MRRLLLAILVFLAGVPAWAAIEMSSWMSYQIRNEETLDQYGRKFTSVCVFAYDFDESDNLRAAQPWVDSELAILMAQPHPHRPVFIMIVNDIESNPPQQHNGDLVLRVLSDPIKRAQHISQIVALSARADGIDIDYEGLLQGTRPYFSQFIQELRAALPSGKLLSVVCQPKTDNADGPRGQSIDWQAIVPHVDILKVMTYYYSFGGSPPGPSAPLDKVRDVTRLAVSQVPLQKLHVALTQFGWDWPDGGPGRFISYADAMAIAQSHGVVPFRDIESQVLRVNYTDNGVAHQIWFPDSTALLGQIGIIQQEGVNKIDVWELGVGDTAFWDWVAANTVNPGEGSDPVLTSISPNSALAGSPSFDLTVTGSNFTDNGVIRWNGQNRSTVYNSPTSLTATIPASDLVAAGIFPVTVLNSASGAVSNDVPFTVIPLNPVPVISNLNPATVSVGSPGFTLTVAGSNFVSGAVVRWNGSDRNTTFVNSTTLSAQITATDVSAVGDATVSVFNPLPGGGTSNNVTFTVTPTNPLPVLVSLSPSSASVGGVAFTLTANGTGFSPNSVIRWNGVDRATTFLSGTALSTVVPASDITDLGQAEIKVFTPLPGGGESEGRIFRINPPPPSPPPLPQQSGPFSNDLEHVRAFPNPWAGDRHRGAPITFDTLTSGATIKLFTTSSRWIKSLTAESGKASWDMTNDSGEPVASGYYLFLITDPEGRKTQGKVAIIK